MAWEKVFSLDALPPGTMTAVDLGDGGSVVLCRIDHEVFALEDRCPHRGGPLSMGNFLPPVVICPWHGWEFDCRSGQCIHSDHAAVKRYPVSIQNGEIYAEFPDA